MPIEHNTVEASEFFGCHDWPSQSLGAQTYERLLRDAGLTWVAEAQDESENHYYFVERRQPPRPGGTTAIAELER